MSLTLLLWIPITLITIIIRLGMAVTRLTGKLALATAEEIRVNVEKNITTNTGSNDIVDKAKDSISTGKRRIKRVTRSVGRGTKNTLKVARYTGKIAKVAVKAGKTTVKLGIQATKTAIAFLKLVIQFLAWVTGIIASMGTVSIIIIVSLMVVTVAGGVFTTLWGDDIKVATDSSSISNVNEVQKSSSVISDDLEALDVDNLDYIIGSSDRKEGIKSSLSRSEVKKFANLLMDKNNTFKCKYGNKVINKYIGYKWGGFHGNTNLWDVDERMGYLKKNIMDTEIIKTLVDSSSKKLRAGLYIKQNKTVHADCSGFVTWFYGTLFSAYDSSKNTDKLANWFYGINSQVQNHSGCVKAIAKSELKPGDICNNNHHIVIYIGNNKIIHSAETKSGVMISDLGSGYTGFYRPKFKFADD